MNVTEQHFHAVLIKYCAVQDTRDDKPRKYIFFPLVLLASVWSKIRSSSHPPNPNPNLPPQEPLDHPLLMCDNSRDHLEEIDQYHCWHQLLIYIESIRPNDPFLHGC